MKETIASLIKLQELDTALDNLLQGQDRLGPQKDKLQADIKALQTSLEDSKKSLTQAQVDKKNAELDIEAKDQAVRKSSGELNSVKSNDAYKALLTQMEEAKKAKSALEDKVLELMERIDALQKESKDRDKKFQEEKSAVEKQIAALDAEGQRLQAEYDAKKKDRDAFFETLPNLVRTPYDALRRGRRGVLVVVPVKGGICGGCRMTLPPSVINDAMKGADLVTCESCSRILYHIPAPSAPKNPETVS